jgi:hypothetical protein
MGDHRHPKLYENGTPEQSVQAIRGKVEKPAVHWPIPDSDFAVDEKVFEQIAMETPAQLR